MLPIDVGGGCASRGFRQLIRGWLGRRLAERRREEVRRRRRDAMEAVWYVTVLGAMERSIARFDKVRASHAFQRPTAAQNVAGHYFALLGAHAFSAGS